MPQKRLVVLIHKDYHLPIVRRGRRLDDQIPEHFRDGGITLNGNAQPGSFAIQVACDGGGQLVHRVVLHRSHVEVDDRPFLRPVPKRFDGESLEQVALPLEEAAERRYGKRLPEPARTRDEELPATRIAGKLLQNRRLVNV